MPTVRLTALIVLAICALASAREIPLSAPAKTLTAAGAKFSTDYLANRMAFLDVDDNWNGTAEDLKQLAALGDTYVIRLHGDKAADAVLPYVDKMPNLKGLQLEGLAFTEEQGKRIAALKIDSLRVTGAKVQHLKFLYADGIRQIEVERLESAGAEFENLPHLESLKIDGAAQRQNRSLALALRNLPKLKRLSITESVLDTLPLASFPQLEELTLYSVTVPDAAIQQLSDLKNLTAVAITYGKQNDLVLAALADSHLKNLNIEGPATDEALLKIRDFSRLESFAVHGPAITDRSLARLAGATGLKEVRIPQAKVAAETFELLGRLRMVQFINLAGATFLPADLKSISTLPNLEYLYLTGTATDDEAVAHLASLPKLRDLDLGQTAVTDAALIHLENAKFLQTLDLRGTKVTEAAVKKLKAARPGMQVFSDF